MYAFEMKLENNPLPYHRTTQGSKWNGAYRRYANWKSQIQSEFFKKYPVEKWKYKDKPIKDPGPWKVDVLITFKGTRHGDPDNILKAVLDSLFETDKYCAASVDFFYAKTPALKINIEKYLPTGF